MAEVWLNGRLAVAWEVAAVEHAARCELERDSQVLAGVLTDALLVSRERVSRPVTDIVWELS